VVLDDPLYELQVWLDGRSSAKFGRGVEGPRVPAELTAPEASYFLAAVAPSDDRPLLIVEDDGHKTSDRYPRKTRGGARRYVFFESQSGKPRLETFIHWAAAARLRDQFGWPRDRLICESPRFMSEGEEVLHQDALDILLLEEPRAELPAKMTLREVSTRIAVETKGHAEGPDSLTSLLDEMRACQRTGTPHDEHAKCKAIAVLSPSLFLAVAAGDTWRLFTVARRDGQAVLGDELSDLSCLHFRQP
jgi:hypothetical protein